MDQNEIITDSVLLAPSSGKSNPTIAQYLTVFRRRRSIFLLGFVCTAVLGILVTILTPPTYRAVAYLLADPPKLQLNQIDSANPLTELFTGMRDYKLETQVRLLQSNELLALTQKKLATRTLPKFTARVVRETDLIELAAEGRNPFVVAKSVNTLLETYISEVADRDGKELSAALEYTKRGAETTLAQLEQKEKELLDYKYTHHIADVDRDRSNRLEEIQRLKSAYQSAVTQYATIRAQGNAIKDQLRQEPLNIPTIVVPETDLAVQSAETQLQTLIAQRQVLLQRYTPANEKVAAVDIQINQQQGLLNRLRKQAIRRSERSNPVFASLRQRVLELDAQALGASAQLASLSRQLVAAEGTLTKYPNWELELSRLQRELDLIKSNYALLSAKYEDVRIRLQLRRVNARIVERAEVPEAPFRPNRTVNIIASLLLGVIIGGAFALFQEYIDDRINSPEDIPQMLPTPHLAAIPLVGPEELRLAVSPELRNTVQKFSPATEAFRNLRTSIRFAAAGARLTTISVTSSVPGEGKSTISLNLAAALGMDEKQVLLIDADLRRPVMHKLLGFKRDRGVTDVLAGTCTIDDVIRPTSVPNVRFISAGTAAPNPAELLGSDAMTQFLENCRTIADIVVFDTPPVLAVADASIVAARTDGVVFVVSLGQATWGRARQSLEILSRAHARVLGIASNRFDLNQNRNGYGYYHYDYAPKPDEEEISSEETGVTDNNSPRLPLGDPGNDLPERNVSDSQTRR